MNKRRLIWTGALITVLGLLIFVALLNQLSHTAKSRIVDQVSELCPRCRLEINKLDFEYFTGTAVFHGIAFRGDPNDTSVVDFKIKKLVLPFYLRDLWNKKFRFNKIEVDGLDVEVADDDKKPASPEIIHTAGYNWVTTLPEFSVESLHVKESKFTYLLKTEVGLGKIRVEDIDLRVGKFGTRPHLSDPKVDYTLKARLENEAPVKIVGREDLFAKINHDAVNIEVDKVNLEKVAGFFEAAASVKLGGFAESLKTDFVVSQGHLDGKISARYRDLNVAMIKTRKQGDLKVLFGNFVASLVVAKDKPPEGQPDAVEQIHAVRAPGQPIIKFIVNSLKTAALQVIRADATQKPKQK